MAQNFTAAEKMRLEKACPPNVKLHYNFQKETYEFLYKPPGAARSKLIGSVPRARVLQWRRPNTIMNFAARHSLYAHKLPTKVKIGGTLVEVHTEKA